jgi:phage gp46-like protein
MRCVRVSAWLAAGLLWFSAVHAAAPATAKTEIDYLLSTVANSDCRFYRNGSWYDAKAAAAHLSSKLQYLLAKDLVQSAEDFIDKAATRSSLSGRAYAIQCKGTEPVPSGQWLQILLARYRESLEAPPNAP